MQNQIEFFAVKIPGGYITQGEYKGEWIVEAVGKGGAYWFTDREQAETVAELVNGKVEVVVCN